MVRDHPGTVKYILRAVIKLEPSLPLIGQAEVRVYDLNGQMILPYLQSEDENYTGAGIDAKTEEDSMWKVGDPEFHYMLFYSKDDLSQFPRTRRIDPVEHSALPVAVYHSAAPQATDAWRLTGEYFYLLDHGGKTVKGALRNKGWG